MTGETEWGADVQSDDSNSQDGLSNETKLLSPDLSPDSLPRAILRLAMALEAQNETLWALVEQTAALINIVAEGAIEDENDAQTYLDGTRMTS